MSQGGEFEDKCRVQGKKSNRTPNLSSNFNSLPFQLAILFVTFFSLLNLSPAKGQDISLHTLPNGLQCAFWPDTTRLLTHVSLTLRGGPLLDPPDADGLANLHGHLLADRSDSLPGDGQISEAVRQNGMVFRHATFAEGNFFSMSLLPPDLENGLALLATAIQYPGYDSASLVQARSTVANEIQFLQSQPEYYHQQALRERLWKRQQHLKNISGSYIQLAALNLNWIRDYISVYLHPNQVLLAGTGNMTPDAFFQMADSLIGSWKFGLPGPAIPLPTAPDLKQPVFFVTENALAAAPVLSIAWPVPGSNEDQGKAHAGDQFRLFAAMASLKRGNFYQGLVEGNLARDVNWNYTPSWAPGQMVMRVVLEPDSLVAGLEKVRDLLRSMTDPDYFSKADYLGAERVIQLQDAMRDDNSLSRLAELGQGWVRGQLQSGSQKRIRANKGVLNVLAAQFTPEKPMVAGLMHNMNIDLLAGLQSIFLYGTALASVEEDTVATVPQIPDSAVSLVRLSGYRIYFETASFQPDGPSLLALDTIAEMLLTYPEMKMYVNGFADGLGDGVANYKLSIERARSVRAVLSGAHQLDAGRLVIRPFGEAFPEWPDDTPEHRAKNRRVTFTVAPSDAVENVF
jgi:predicted Zn-dependent peptidase/outer membrane protein OmpA-like peptidoglycan-associated protein